MLLFTGSLWWPPGTAGMSGLTREAREAPGPPWVPHKQSQGLSWFPVLLRAWGPETLQVLATACIRDVWSLGEEGRVQLRAAWVWHTPPPALSSG